jgi:hypothetical protein
MKKINFCEYRNLIANLSDYYGNNFQLYNKQESQQKEGGGGASNKGCKYQNKDYFMYDQLQSACLTSVKN